MIIFIITIIILVIIIVSLIIYLGYVEKTRISPLDCPRLRGDFAIKPFYTGTTLQTCGNDSTSACVFSGITTIKSAIDQCNIHNCLAFIYQANVATMSILSPQQPITSGGSGDVYLRQTGVI